MARGTTHYLVAAWMAAGIPVGCNAVLNNQEGHLDDAAIDAASLDAPSSDSSNTSMETSVDSSVQNVESGLDAAADTATDRDDAQGPADAGAADVTDAATIFSPVEAGVTLVLWLEGDDGVQTTACEAGLCVVGWTDRSAWHNDAVLPDGGRPPTVSTVASHGAVSFVDPDGGDTSSSLLLQDSTSLEVRSFTLVAVATDRDSLNPHTGVVYSKQITGQYPFPGVGLFLDCSNSQLSSASGQACSQIDVTQYVASSDVGLFDGTLRAYVAVFDAVAMTLSFGVNGEPWRTVAAAGIPTAGGAPAHIGGVQGARQTMTGDIAELMLLDVPVSPLQWGAVYGYLRGRYGLP